MGTPPTPPAATAATSGTYTIQVAAFRDIAGARADVRTLKNAGYEARMVTVPANALIRVRVGLYDKASDATAVLSKLKSAGYQPVFVSDVSREKIVND